MRFFWKYWRWLHTVRYLRRKHNSKNRKAQMWNAKYIQTGYWMNNNISTQATSWSFYRWKILGFQQNEIRLAKYVRMDQEECRHSEPGVRPVVGQEARNTGDRGWGSVVWKNCSDWRLIREYLWIWGLNSIHGHGQTPRGGEWTIRARGGA